MKRYIYFLSFLFLMNITGCNRQESNLSFSEDRFNIEGQILLNEDLLLDPEAILLHDSILVIENQKGEPLIELYDIYGNAGAKFLSKGSGPEDIAAFGGFQKSVTNNNIYVYDLFQKKFLEFDIKRSFKSAIRPDTVYNYSGYLYFHQKDSMVLFDKLFMGKDCLIGQSRDVRGRIVLLNFDGSLIGFAGNFPPKTYEELPDYENTHLYGTDFILNNDASKLALATHSAEMIDIFDISKISNPKLV
ncbi:MAG: 6-bladed beta-propeller, partial [Dysgonamonadaceae bacterium]|nr:6-bladed beta-propeller [Dysgonamonadaceae bacterium]